MNSRFGAFLIGFASGMVAAAAVRRIREFVSEEDYEKLAESVQSHLEALEARLVGTETKAGARVKAKA